ncbi:MAG TPA: type III secretion system outer membrane ring subunit SctC [Burkholderiaceae bacterium]|nr:type III secretion system outer membrane ring subunit SctC [Burkholderiaceae bacterium]
MAGIASTQRLRQAGKWLLGCLKRGAWIALAAGALASGAASAAPMPNGGRLVQITAREQPIGAFLQDLFATIDVPAQISPSLAGNVNGTFAGPADKVLRDVSRVYNLVTYFDGSVMHVTPMSEMARRTYAVAPAVGDRLLREAADLNLTDPRNTLRRSADGNMIATGARRFVEQIDELLRAGQAQDATPSTPPGAADFRVFYLRYAWAQDVTMTIGGRQVVVPGVASILRSLVDPNSHNTYRPLGREVLLRPTQPSLKGQGLIGQGVSTKAPTTGEAARNNAIDNLVTALARTAAPADAASAPAGYPDPMQVRIEADQRLNAVIVRDTADRLPRYEQLIASLDVEPQSLEIEATIIDVNTDKARELGIEWRWANDGRSASFQGAVPSVGNGGVASVVLGSLGQFFARIRALQNEGAARIVSSPQVVTLSNVEAVFDNTSTFFVRVAGREQVDLFNVSAGTTLRVTPHVFRDRDQTRIKLLVNVEDGAITGQQVDQIPVIERSTVNTQALIAEGESLLIGGMVRETKATSEDKVPGLGDVPVVGNLFKTKATQNTRVERMFLITPRMAGTRQAPPQATLGTLRSGPTPVTPAAPAPMPAPATTPGLQTAAPPAATTRVAATPAVAPQPAPAGTMQPVPMPAPIAPAARASVVVDLDAMTSGPPRQAAIDGRDATATRVSTSQTK